MSGHAGVRAIPPDRPVRSRPDRGRRTRLRRLRLALSLLPLLLVGALPRGAEAQEILRIEAEHFIEAWTQGLPAQAVPCETASNDTTVKYLDWAGDWIRLRFELPFDALAGFKIRSASLPGTRRHWRTELFVTGEETPLLEETLVTRPGDGMG